MGKKYLSFLLLHFILSTLLVAQTTYNWTGTSSADWTVGSNWQGGTAPTIQGGILKDYLNINVAITGYYPTFNNLTIGRNQGQNVNYGSITVAPGARLTLTGRLIITPTYGSLTIQSNSSSDGLLRFDATAQYAGTSNVELALKGGLNGSLPVYHYFVPPVQSMSIGITPTISETKTALGITNFTGDLIRFLETAAISTKEQGWQFFDNWPGTPPGFTTLTPSRGYNIYLTSDDKITFKGLLNGAQQVFNLSYTSGNVGAGWNLIGNPFPCNYNLNGVAGLGTVVSGISNTVYYNNNGGYQYWNVFTNAGSTGGYSDIVPPMTGFFVLVSATGKSLTFPVASKTFSAGDSRSQHKGLFSLAEDTVFQKIKLVLTSGSENDETVVLLSNVATSSFNEHYDAYKLFSNKSSGPSIFCKLEGINYFMKAVLPPVENQVVVPLELILRQSGIQTIEVTEFENFSGVSVKLRQGIYETPLKLGSSYTFNSDPGTYSDIQLVFNNSTLGTDLQKFNTSKSWFSNGYLYINFPDEIPVSNSRLIIYDFNGRQLYTDNNLQVSPAQTIQIPLTLQHGFYIADIVINKLHHRSKFVIN
jgi:hypothetical protein